MYSRVSPHASWAHRGQGLTDAWGRAACPRPPCAPRAALSCPVALTQDHHQARGASDGAASSGSCRLRPPQPSQPARHHPRSRSDPSILQAVLRSAAICSIAKIDASIHATHCTKQSKHEAPAADWRRPLWQNPTRTTAKAALWPGEPQEASGRARTSDARCRRRQRRMPPTCFRPLHPPHDASAVPALCWSPASSHGPQPRPLPAAFIIMVSPCDGKRSAREGACWGVLQGVARSWVCPGASSHKPSLLVYAVRYACRT